MTLVFEPDQRPGLAALRELAASSAAGPASAASLPAFSLSHSPAPRHGWAELLSQGLTFDCAHLSPAPSARPPRTGALLGLAAMPMGEAITLAPGPHLADAVGMIPVVRTLAGIGARLASLPGAQAVSWNPARCWMPVSYFCKVVSAWLGGGPFPALGLTSLERESDGSIVSVGLSLLTGQELRFRPDPAFDNAGIARIAVRLIHALLEIEPLTAPQEFTGPDGEPLLVSPRQCGILLDVTIQR